MKSLYATMVVLSCLTCSLFAGDAAPTPPAATLTPAAQAAKQLEARTVAIMAYMETSGERASYEAIVAEVRKMFAGIPPHIMKATPQLPQELEAAVMPHVDWATLSRKIAAEMARVLTDDDIAFMGTFSATPEGKRFQELSRKSQRATLPVAQRMQADIVRDVKAVLARAMAEAKRQQAEAAFKPMPPIAPDKQ